MIDLYNFISMHRYNPNLTRKHELSPIVNYISKFCKLRIYVHCKSIGVTFKICIGSKFNRSTNVYFKNHINFEDIYNNENL
jgi:DNA-binding XRE family transcriptional regulator